MTWILVRKLLWDVRWPLLVIALLLLAFQVLWAVITARVLGELAPFFTRLASFGGFTRQDIEAQVFSGPGQLVKSIIGGDAIQLDHAMDMLSIGYVHPLVQLILCIWAIGRAAGAISGEIERGTMELLLAQPLARYRVVLAHLLVDCVVIPALCLALLVGNFVGASVISPIRIQEPEGFKAPDALYSVEVGPFKFEVKGAIVLPPEDEAYVAERLAVRPWEFAPGLALVAGLLFAISGATMWLSAAGRSRMRVLGVAILVALVMFLVNVLGQMWDVMAPLRPLTLFYYYNAQAAVLGQGWTVPVAGLPVPTLPVLVGVGVLGYAMAFRVFTRRDLPAPL